MKPITTISQILTAASLLIVPAKHAFSERPVVLDTTFAHYRFGTLPRDIIREFRAFTTSFDSFDHNDRHGEDDALGIFEWVAYEIRRFKGDCIQTKSRPTWFAVNYDWIMNPVSLRIPRSPVAGRLRVQSELGHPGLGLKPKFSSYAATKRNRACSEEEYN